MANTRRVRRLVAPAPERGLRAAAARPGEQTGGPRIALAYAATLLVLAVAFALAFGGVSLLYDRGAICRADEGLACPVLSYAGTFLVVAGLLLGAAAWWFRLGWRFWVATFGLALSLLDALGPFSPWLGLGLLVPLLAALASDRRLPGRLARTIAVVAVGAVGLGWCVVVLVFAAR